MNILFVQALRLFNFKTLRNYCFHALMYEYYYYDFFLCDILLKLFLVEKNLEKNHTILTYIFLVTISRFQLVSHLPVRSHQGRN